MPSTRHAQPLLCGGLLYTFWRPLVATFQVFDELWAEVDRDAERGAQMAD